MVELSRHAERRMQQRGCNPAFIRKILDYADIDVSVGSRCRLYRVDSSTAADLCDDRIGRFGVIVNETKDTVVTILPIASGRRGAGYRRGRRSGRGA